MRRLRRIFWLGLKEAVSLRRDPVMLALLIWAFSFAIIVEATGGSTSVNNASIGFVDEDGSSLSRNLAEAFFPPEFQPVTYLDAEEIDDAMDRGELLFVVVVPPRFEADIRAGRAPEIQVLIDATAMEQAGIGQRYVTTILDQEIERFALRRDLGEVPSVALIVRSAFNPNRDAVAFQGVVSLVNKITIMMMLLAGAAVMREREHGTIEHLLALPLDPLDIAAAKIFANSVIVLLATVLAMLLIVDLLLGVEIAGSRALFLVGTSLYLFSAAALGLFLAMLARSMAQFALLTILAIMAVQFLSGGETPVEGQPGWLQHLTLLLPSRHFISFGQAVVFKGAGPASIWLELMAMVGLGLALLAVSLLLFRSVITTDR